MTGHVVACGAGRAMMDRHDDPYHEYVLRLTGKRRPRVLFLPTASGDDAGYVESFYRTYGTDRCEPHHLALFARTVSVADLPEYLMSFDVITVGGGNTANMYDVWHLHGVDALLREAWRNGKVLTGGSAGGICWFYGGTTDSFGLPYQALPRGLRLIDEWFCPHYDAEDGRRPVFHRALLDGVLPTGYGVDNLVGLHFDGRVLVRAISSDPKAKAVRVTVRDGEVVEKPIRVRLLS
ncbi:peptidase E [Streptomyces sp. NPDC001941]|uniref:Type 1 glutamine amidotransferase-like domain-containing protein n=1 Tax=Streptomyces sp. NPDC001941 TaxID=3154659 RepID=UPI00331E2AD3